MSNLISLHKIYKNKKVIYLDGDNWDNTIKYAINEYNLIVQKKSSLSRKNRDMILNTVDHLISDKIIKVRDIRKKEVYEKSKEYQKEWRAKNRERLKAKNKERYSTYYKRLIKSIKEELVKEEIVDANKSSDAFVLFLFMYKTNIRNTACLSKHLDIPVADIDLYIKRWKDAGIMVDNNIVIEKPSLSKIGLIIGACMISLVGDGEIFAKLKENEKEFIYTADKNRLNETTIHYPLIKNIDLAVRTMHSLIAYFNIPYAEIIKKDVSILKQVSESRLLKFRNTGVRTLNELKYIAKQYNIQLLV